MKKLILFIAVVAMGVLSFSCSDDIGSLLNEEAQGQQKPHCLSPEQAKRNVEAFLEALENSGSPAARSLSGKKREISDIQVIGKTDLSRSDIPSEIGDSSLYIFNFRDSTGFVIGGTRPDQSPVYVIVDEGNYNFKMFREETNEGFKWYVTQLMDAVFEWDEGGSGYPKPDTIIDEWIIYSVVEPIIGAKWGQGNMLNPQSYGKLFKNKVAGCAITAVAQILYNFSTPTNVRWIEDGTIYSSEIRWPRIKLDCSNCDGKLHPNKTPNSMNEVAHLCRYLGVQFNAVDTIMGKTSTKPRDVMYWLRNKSGLIATELKKYDGDAIVNAVKNNKIVYVQGSYDKEGQNGHAWVIDGCIDARRNDKNEKLVHCNWGYNGDKNGYYMNKMFNLNVGPEIDDDQLNLNGSVVNYYKYNVSYSIIYR